MTHEHDPLTEALRDSLHSRAADAPDGTFLVDRILATVERAPEPAADRRRSWRTWTLPLIAAGAVAAVVGTVVGVANFSTEASHSQPGTQLPSLLQTSLPTQLVTPTPAPTTTQGPTTAPPPRPSGLTDIRITDLTFVGNDDGWALGSADCLSGAGRCTALWRTVDGHTWTSVPGAQFNVPGVDGCADPCVRNLRFANDEVGYAFGPSALFLTADGGASWHREPGGALALETLDNNVIRITGTASGCPGPCLTGIETADVGSSMWTPASFTPPTSTVGSAQLVRGNGGYAYLLVTANPAGGANDAASMFYRSTDGGASWTMHDEPCAITDGGEIDSTAIAGGGGGRVTVLCATRQAPQSYHVAWSDDAGTRFGQKPGEIPADVTPTLLTGDPTTVLVAAGRGGMARSTDGGATWQQVDGVNGAVGWVGFESQTVGRAVSADGATIWTTHDGGASWRAATID